MSDTLYDRDILLWSEQQAATLQRLADGERVNDAIDWPNLIDEVLDVGRSEFNSVQSRLEQALVHIIKLHVSPNSEAANHWRSEAAAFRREATQRFSPAMRSRIDVSTLFSQALDQLRDAEILAADHEVNAQPCPYVLDDLLTGTRSVAELVAALSGSSA